MRNLLSSWSILSNCIIITWGSGLKFIWIQDFRFKLFFLLLVLPDNYHNNDSILMRLNAYHNNTCTLAKFQCQWNKRQGSRNSVNEEIYVYLTWPRHIATKKNNGWQTNGRQCYHPNDLCKLWPMDGNLTCHPWPL